jgi:Tol biopolymer transport system component
MSADGVNQRNLNVGPVSTNLLMTWAPDGRLAWQQSTPPNFLNFRLKDLASGQETYLSPAGKGWIFHPEFSPVSDEVAIDWNRPEPGLYVLSGPSREERRLATDLMPLGWSPDGKWIYAFRHRGGHGGREVVRLALETGQIIPVASITGGAIADGDVSRDGRQIALCVAEMKADVCGSST